MNGDGSASDQSSDSLHRATVAGEPTAATPCLISGTANEPLANEIAKRLGIELLGRRFETFPDSETYVQVSSSVRGRDAYIIQPTCAPVNDHLFELLLMLDALRRASAARITAVIPYYGYARQDRKFSGREPITAKLVANLLAAAGATRVVAIDLHSPAVQGFFEIGMDHLTAVPLLCDFVRKSIPRTSVVISPDTGGVKRADYFARLLDLPIAILHKRRSDASRVEIAAVVGDIRDCTPIIVDDIIATGGTIHQAVDALIQAGARPEVTVVATHGIFAGDAVRLLSHPAISSIVITDTVPVNEAIRNELRTLHVISVADLLADAICRLHQGMSLSALFSHDGAPPI